MAPTIQTQAQREDGHRSGVVCRVKYCNSLPDIPFDPKFITYPFDQNRFVQYKATSLEKQHKHDLLTEPDLGVTIDLINPDTYRIDPNVLLDPADEKLLEEEIQAPTSSKRSQQHAKVVPWMRKTEYISTEFNRYGISNEKPEVKIGVSVKQQFTEEEIYKDRDSQITAIEKTFEDAQKSISQHYSKPRVTPVEVMPVFPDFKMWINPCAQVIFDSDPAPKDTSGAAALEMMSQAMIRGMMDEEGNQFVAYFLPVEETLKKRKRDQEEEMDYAPDDVYDYKIAREYNWNVKNKASKGYEENYFFIFREGDGVYYNELETRVRLSKRRAKAGVQSGTNALLVVKHRDMNEKELEAQEARKAQLENHEPEEEEEEEMETEEKEAGGSVMRIRKTMRILMTRTEARPVAVTMTRTVAVMGVASGAGAAVPVPSPVAVSTPPRKMAVKLQLPIPVKPTVTVTESQVLQGWCRHDYNAITTRRKALFEWSVGEPFPLFPSSPPSLAVNKADFSPFMSRPSPVVSFALYLSFPPPPPPHPRSSVASA
ncbi:PREDICTED: RNA polymerase II-associated factor 1 homolog isoform X1 [Odobenus rosmarus divergens]|uniref:RNA polymerase II-associated factor 1 homolog n=1 Tax=Odobenus rosmarus divergens TaxID=9708 RepID=A0A2U3VMY8_ODORO|nr:PREDICTED: RNA polymerase II-associated factor 1 homolog isoform X1 [Odobenus rosmarus divergens]